MPKRAGGAKPRRRPKWHARRDAIIDTSAQVFAQRGFHRTGIAELCTANGLGKGGLYHYIGSKEQLLAAIHDRVMDEVLLGADRVGRAGGSARQQLSMLGEVLLDVIARYPYHVWVFLHEYPALTDDAADRSEQRRREYDRRIEAILLAGMDAGEFRSDIDVALVGLAWLGMHNYTYRWLRDRTGCSSHQVAGSFAALLLDGLTPRSPAGAGGAS
jgi:TetR/AcrR family transcriptional regulator, cholesterol catabolism regulator